MIIFLIGPSRGGKTTLLKKIREHFKDATMIDLDAEESKAVAELKKQGNNPGGWEERWQRNKVLLNKFEWDHKGGNNLILIDVGAGSL